MAPSLDLASVPSISSITLYKQYLCQHHLPTVLPHLVHGLLVPGVHALGEDGGAQRVVDVGHRLAHSLAVPAALQQCIATTICVMANI